MSPERRAPLRVPFPSTRNSARSRIAEAMLSHEARATGGGPVGRRQPWDLIIMVSDRTMRDPGEGQGNEATVRRSIDSAPSYLSRRIDLLPSLPFESAARSAFELRAQRLAHDAPVP